MFGLFFSVLGVFVFVNSGSASAATFDPTRIIDDGIFYNNTTMTVDQIQAFLNSKMPTCDSNGTQAYGNTTRAAYTRSKGYAMPLVCLKDYYENPANHSNNLTKVDGVPAAIPAGGQSAAQIIYTAANYYAINPQVLLVLLQKEEGLVTDDWPWPSQFKIATGFGCPDTAPCDSQYFGFSNQVNWAARQFRSYATTPNQFNYVPGPGNNVSFNPNASCGYSTLNIQNQATASLYDYTPYQPDAAALAAGYGTGDACGAYGNRNFWLYFNEWFGSTQFPQPVGGSLLYQSSTGKVFLTTGNTRFYISSWDMIVNYGLDVFPVQPVSDPTIQQYSDGGVLTNLAYDSNGVYLINNRTRYHVSSSMCTSWGFSCLDNSVVKQLDNTFATAYLKPGGELTEMASLNGVTYEMINGKKQPVENVKTLQDLGLSAISVIPSSNINFTQPYGPLLITTPGIVRLAGNSSAYYFDGTSFYDVPDSSVYDNWNLGTVPQWSAPTSSYNTTPPTSIALSPWYKDGSGNEFIVDQGRLVAIPLAMQNAWQSVTFVNTQPQILINSLPKTTVQPFISSNGVYQLANDKLHHIPTYASYIALGVTDSQTTVLRPDKTSPVPVANDALGDGQVIALQTDNQSVYVTENGKMARIPDYSTLIAYGYNLGSTLVYPSTILNDYPLAASPLGNTFVNNSYYLVGPGMLYQVPAAQAADFGTIGSQFQSTNANVTKYAHPVGLSRFMYNVDTGKIYYASGGAIHYIATYSAFVAYGGTRIPASAINNNVKSLLFEAQPVY